MKRHMLGASLWISCFARTPCGSGAGRFRKDARQATATVLVPEMAIRSARRRYIIRWHARGGQRRNTSLALPNPLGIQCGYSRHGNTSAERRYLALSKLRQAECGTLLSGVTFSAQGGLSVTAPFSLGTYSCGVSGIDEKIFWLVLHRPEILEE